MFNKINELLENKLYMEARQEIAEMNPVDIAALIEEFPEDERTKIFRLLPKSLAADVFSYLPIELEQDIIVALSDKEAGHILDNPVSYTHLHDFTIMKIFPHCSVYIFP